MQFKPILSKKAADITVSGYTQFGLGRWAWWSLSIGYWSLAKNSSKTGFCQHLSLQYIKQSIAHISFPEVLCIGIWRKIVVVVSFQLSKQNSLIKWNTDLKWETMYLLLVTLSLFQRLANGVSKTSFWGSIRWSRMLGYKLATSFNSWDHSRISIYKIERLRFDVRLVCS